MAPFMDRVNCLNAAEPVWEDGLLLTTKSPTMKLASGFETGTSELVI